VVRDQESQFEIARETPRLRPTREFFLTKSGRTRRDEKPPNEPPGALNAYGIGKCIPLFKEITLIPKKRKLVGHT